MNLAKKLAALLFLAVLSNSSPLFANPPVRIWFITEPPSSIPVGASLTNIVVQLVDKDGTFVAQSGYAISMSLNQAGLGGVTNAVTDTNGQAFFNDLVFSMVGTGFKLSANATGLKSGISSGFTVTNGATTTTLVSSTNLLVYGQNVVFTAAVASASPFTSVPTGTITFSDGSTVVGTKTLNAAGVAIFATNQLSATTSHTITVIYGGDTNFLASTGTLVQATARLPLSVSGIIASNKIYDRTTSTTLNFAGATLVGVLAGDAVTLNSASATDAFTNATVGNGKPVSVTGLALAGASAGNYSVPTQTTTASITPRNLVITASGVNKIYDGTANATVTLTDNRLTGDTLTDGYSTAAFVSKTAGTTVAINVSGLSIGGASAGNYNLNNSTAATSANISPAPLQVTAASLSRTYGTTNPALTAVYSGFVAGESLANSDVTGSPALVTAANTNSNGGTYSITISQSTLASADYNLSFSNGVLAVTQAGATELLSTSLNPALTNQTVTFAATVNSLSPCLLPPTGVVQFRCNGTNPLGGPVTLSGGTASVTVLAATLGASNTVITAEYSDPAGNFKSSTNSLTQAVIAPTTPPPPSKLSLTSVLANGTVTGQVNGTAGQAYVIQASTDLMNWISLYTNTADTNGIVFLVDSNSAAFSKRFYRAYSP